MLIKKTKTLFQSKTFWVNAITTVLALATAAAGQDWVKQNPGTTALLGAIVGVLNIGLRYVTTLPIE